MHATEPSPTTLPDPATATDKAPPRAAPALLDSFLTHVWKPLLHQMAAGTLRAYEGMVDFLPQARRHHFRFHLGAMESLDRRRRQVRLAPLRDGDGLQIAPRRTVHYDTLVLCVGSVVNDFGIPGVSEHALRLDSADDARRVRVRPTLRAEGDDHILALGDCAHGRLAGAPEGATMPRRAQAAHQQARFLARARPLPAFRFRDHGALESIGRGTAAGSLVGQLTGRRFNLHGPWHAGRTACSSAGTWRCCTARRVRCWSRWAGGSPPVRSPA